MFKENLNKSDEGFKDGDLQGVSGGEGFFGKIWNGFKGLFGKKSSAQLEGEAKGMDDGPLLPKDDED